MDAQGTRMGYTKQSFIGFFAHGGFKGSALVITAIKIAILARLLQPSDFGQFAMVAVVLGITESLTETGINTIIVQSFRSIEYYVDSAWVISIFRGLGIGILMVISSMWLEKLMDMSGLAWLVTVAALIPIIKGFINPAIISFYKKLQFGQDAMYRLSLVIVEATASIAISWVMRSAFALIAGMMISAIFEVVISFLFVRVRPQFRLVPSRVKEIWGHSAHLNLSAILSYLLFNIDNVIVGKLLGSTGLGLYQNGFALSHKPNLEVAKSAQHSLFPIFAAIENNQERVRRAFWKSLRSVLILTTLLSLPLLIAPSFIVQIFLGEKWLLVIPLLQALTLAGVTQSGITVAYTLLTAQKEYSFLNLHLLASVVLMVGLLFLLVPEYQLPGAVAAVLLSRLLVIPFMVYIILITWSKRS